MRGCPCASSYGKEQAQFTSPEICPQKFTGVFGPILLETHKGEENVDKRKAASVMILFTGQFLNFLAFSGTRSYETGRESPKHF